MNTLLTVLGVVAAAAITGYLTYLATRRQRSGDVRTTEAERLWGASEKMRDELREEIVALRARIVVLEERLMQAEALFASLKGKP